MNLLEESFASYVNLDHRRDRLILMLQSLQRAGIRAVRTRGLRPQEVKVDPARVARMKARTPGAIGCHFAQVKIMEEAFKMGRHAFVMEDDLIICSDFHERMAIISEFCAGHPWDIIWLGGTFHTNPPYWHQDQDAELTDHPRMVRTYGAFCTYAYIVRYESIQKVLKLLDEELDNTIGIDYSMIQFQKKLFTYAFVPGCITQYDNQSDIGKGITKFSGFAKLGPYWFQQKMTEFDPTTYDWKEAKNPCLSAVRS